MIRVKAQSSPRTWGSPSSQPSWAAWQPHHAPRGRCGPSSRAEPRPAAPSGPQGAVRARTETTTACWRSGAHQYRVNTSSKQILQQNISVYCSPRMEGNQVIMSYLATSQSELPNSAFITNLFSFALLCWWNERPNSIQTAESLTVLKKQAKTHLFPEHLINKYIHFYAFTSSVLLLSFIPSCPSLYYFERWLKPWITSISRVYYHLMIIGLLHSSIVSHFG